MSQVPRTSQRQKTLRQRRKSFQQGNLYYLVRFDALVGDC